MAAALDLAVTPWGVLSAGVLTGKPRDQLRWPEDADSERAQRVVAALRSVADEAGATPAQVAIAWLLHRPTPPTFVPIVAARREEQIGENVAALEVHLDDEQLAQLDEAAAPQLGFPRNFLESQSVRELIYGETFPQIAA
jgi:aryl-alcohol dehydrogenase-like predicted oxidoreductase